MTFMFENLKVYQKALDLAEAIIRQTEAFRKDNVYLADQLKRASASISVNIAEGNGRRHHRERQQFFYMARGSAQECVPLVEICRRMRLVTDEKAGELRQQVREIAKMLTALAQRGGDEGEVGTRVVRAGKAGEARGKS